MVKRVNGKGWRRFPEWADIRDATALLMRCRMVRETPARWCWLGSTKKGYAKEWIMEIKKVDYGGEAGDGIE